MGPPGAGKGSLAGLIKEKRGVAHISTGDMLREEMSASGGRLSPLGLQIKGLIERGALVSDDIVTRLVEARLTTDAQLTKGFMLDGFPRTVQQAKDLDQILSKAGRPLDFALNMETDINVILKRLTGRRVCKKCGALYHLSNKPPQVADVCDACGGVLYQRSDDNEATIRKRMEIYIANTKPMVDYYAASGRLREISGNKETVDVREDLIKILDNVQKPNQAQKPG